MNTTAIENLSADFYWLPAFLETTSKVVGGFGPVIALLGAVYIYFKKEQSERASKAKELRREIYVQFLQRVTTCRNSLTDRDNKSKMMEEFQSASLIHNEIRLVSNNDISEGVIELLGKLLEMVQTRGAMEDQLWFEALNETNGVIEAQFRDFFECEVRLVKIFREDLTDS